MPLVTEDANELGIIFEYFVFVQIVQSDLDQYCLSRFTHTANNYLLEKNNYHKS